MSMGFSQITPAEKSPPHCSNRGSKCGHFLQSKYCVEQNEHVRRSTLEELIMLQE